MTLLWLLCLLPLALGDESCPAWQPWNEFSQDCLFFPVPKIAKKIVEHCQIPVPPGTPEREGLIPLPPGWTPPTSPCGNCGFHVRCRKRAGLKDGCFSLEADRKACTSADHAGASDICDLPKTVRGDCHWDKYNEGYSQCVNANPLLPEWRRDGYRKLMHDTIPKGHCHEHGGRCKCCCSPYHPSEDGTQCVKKEPDSCPSFGPYNEWGSQCHWFPLKGMIQGIRDQCQITSGLPLNLPDLSTVLEIPEKCGYCSFKTRCRKRDDQEGCFAVDVDKKNCGPNDCPTCGNVCTLNKLNNTCDYSAALARRVLKAMGEAAKAAETAGHPIPEYKKDGYQKLLTVLPWSKCIDKDDKCHCCCHPFEPIQKEDGTIECQTRNACKGPWMKPPPTA